MQRYLRVCRILIPIAILVLVALANVLVWDLAFLQKSSTLVAGTHGRGLWTAKVQLPVKVKLMGWEYYFR